MHIRFGRGEEEETDWHPIIALPNFNGKVEVKLQDGQVISCWYETGDRRFPKGFSLLNPRLIPTIVEWRKI